METRRIFHAMISDCEKRIGSDPVRLIRVEGPGSVDRPTKHYNYYKVSNNLF